MTGPMTPEKTMLDGPPPLPKEASRKAPPVGLAPNTSMGDMGGMPMMQQIALTKQVESGIQELAALNPVLAPRYAALIQEIRQLAAEGLAAAAQPQGVGAPMGMMTPPMHMPPMGAGAM